MRPNRSIRAAGALAFLALAVPASASAVPTVTSVVARAGNPGVTYATDPTGAALTNTQVRYALSLDGYAVGFSEDNGVTGGGVLDYSALPAEYRAPATAAEKVVYPGAQTGLQAHATCSGVASLSSAATIASWQANDPSYAYVPWQKTAAGLGDDPARWIAVARSATGVDLAAAPDLRVACTGLGGTWHAADTSSAIAGALVAAAIAPLEAQIAALRRSEDTLRRAKEASDRATATARTAQAAARDAQKAAEEAYQALFTRPIDLSLATRRFSVSDGVALVTGSATDPVSITVEVTRAQRRALRLPSRVLVEANAVIGPDGAVLVRLLPDRATARRLSRALARQRRGLAVSVLAVSGGNDDAIKATLTR